jgi:hypothetical protein
MGGEVGSISGCLAGKGPYVCSEWFSVTELLVVVLGQFLLAASCELTFVILVWSFSPVCLILQFGSIFSLVGRCDLGL